MGITPSSRSYPTLLPPCFASLCLTKDVDIALALLRILRFLLLCWGHHSSTCFEVYVAASSFFVKDIAPPSCITESVTSAFSFAVSITFPSESQEEFSLYSGFVEDITSGFTMSFSSPQAMWSPSRHYRAPPWISHPLHRYSKHVDVSEGRSSGSYAGGIAPGNVRLYVERWMMSHRSPSLVSCII